jgi:hypothetical protein
MLTYSIYIHSYVRHVCEINSCSTAQFCMPQFLNHIDRNFLHTHAIEKSRWRKCSIGVQNESLWTLIWAMFEMRGRKDVWAFITRDTDTLNYVLLVKGERNQIQTESTQQGQLWHLDHLRREGGKVTRNADKRK